MLLTALLCQAILGADVETPVSAVDAIAIARLPDYFSEPDSETAALFAMPVARVNGQVITAEDVLARWAEVLRVNREMKSSEEYAKLVQTLIEQELPAAVTNAVVLAAAKRDTGSEQFELQFKYLENLWETERLPQLARQFASQDGKGRLPYVIRLATIKQQFIQAGQIGAYIQSKVSQEPSVWDDQKKAWKPSSIKMKKFIDDEMDEANIKTAYSLSSRR